MTEDHNKGYKEKQIKTVNNNILHLVLTSSD